MARRPTACRRSARSCILEGLKQTVKADFYTASTRPPAVYRGNPFQVEVGLAYGGELPADELVDLYRFANRVPLQYQQSALRHHQGRRHPPTGRATGCSSRKGRAPDGADGPHRAHRLGLGAVHLGDQGGGRVLPRDPARRCGSALQECGRRLGIFLRRRRREADAEKKRSYIEKYIPHIGIALQEILELSRQGGEAHRDGADGHPGADPEALDLSEKGDRRQWRRTRQARIEKTAADIQKTILKHEEAVDAVSAALAHQREVRPEGRLLRDARAKRKERTLTVNTVKTFAQTLRMMALSKQLVETDDIATKREAYYVSKNWDDARFVEQPESDTVMDDVEALFEVNREQLGFIPEEKGGEVAGKLVIVDKDSRHRKAAAHRLHQVRQRRLLDSDLGRASQVRDRRQVHPGDRDRGHVPAPGEAQLLEDAPTASWSRWEACRRAPAGASSAGWPTRRRSRSTSSWTAIPTASPTSTARSRSGSGNAAHLNEFFCVPQARFLGITPQDIVDYKLPTHPLKDVDVKRAKDAIKNDPFFQHHKEWADAMEQLVKMGVRAEQQALAKHGLNYVIDKYLPEKLAHPEKFLP